MLDLANNHFETGDTIDTERLKQFFAVNKEEEIIVSDLFISFNNGASVKDYSIDSLYIASKKGDKTVYTKITTFAQLKLAYVNNQICVYNSSTKMYSRLDRTSGNTLHIMPKNLKKVANPLYITDRYDEPGTHSISYGIKRLMDVKSYDVEDKKEIFKTTAGRGRYLYLQLKGGSGWDYYPKENLVYYEGSVEHKLKDADLSAVDINTWLQEHQIYYKDGGDLKLVIGMLTTKDFNMTLHRDVVRDVGTGKETEQIVLADKTIMGRIVGNNVVADDGSIVGRLDGTKVLAITRTPSGKITTSGSSTKIKIGGKKAIDITITAASGGVKNIKSKAKSGAAAKVIGKIEDGVVYLKESKGRLLRIGELNEETGDIVLTTETELGDLQADGTIKKGGTFVGERELKRATQPTLEHLNIQDLTIEEFVLDEFGQPVINPTTHEPMMAKRKLDGTYTEQEFKTAKDKDGKTIQQMDLTTYGLVPEGKGDYIRLRVKGKAQPILFSIKPGESKVYLGDIAIEYDHSNLEKTQNVIRSIVGQELTVEIDGKKYVTEKVTMEEAISTYSKEKTMTKSNSDEDILGDDTYLRLANGKYVKESEFVRPLAYNFVKNDSTDFDAYLFYYKKDGVWQTIILNKETFDKAGGDIHLGDLHISKSINAADLYKIKKSTKPLAESHIIQTTNENADFEGAVTLVRKPDDASLSSLTFKEKDGAEDEEGKLDKKAALTEAKRLFRELYKQGKYDIDKVVVDGVVYKLDNVVKNEDGTTSFHVSNSRHVYANHSLVEDPTAKLPQYANMSNNPVKYDAKSGKLYGGTRYNMGKANKAYFKYWGKIWAWPTAMVLMCMGVFALAIPVMIAPALAVLTAGWVAGPIFNLIMKLKQEKKFESKAKLARKEAKKKFVQELNDLYKKVLEECKAVDEKVDKYATLEDLRNAYAENGLVYDPSIEADAADDAAKFEKLRKDLKAKLKAPIRTKFLEAYTKIYQNIQKGLGVTYSKASFSMKDGKVDESNAWLFSEFKKKLDDKKKELEAEVKSGDKTEEEMKKELADFASSYEASSDMIGVDPERDALLMQAETMKAVILLKGGLDKPEDVYKNGKTDDPSAVILEDKHLTAIENENLDYVIKIKKQTVKEEITVNGKKKTKKEKREVVLGEFVEAKKVRRKKAEKEKHKTEMAGLADAMNTVGKNVTNFDYTSDDNIMSTNAHSDDILDVRTDEVDETAVTIIAVTEAVTAAETAVATAEAAYKDAEIIATTVPKAVTDKDKAKAAWEAARLELEKAKVAKTAIETNAEGTDNSAEVEKAKAAAEEAEKQAGLAEKYLKSAQAREKLSKMEITAQDRDAIRALFGRIERLKVLHDEMFNTDGTPKAGITDAQKREFQSLIRDVLGKETGYVVIRKALLLEYNQTTGKLASRITADKLKNARQTLAEILKQHGVKVTAKTDITKQLEALKFDNDATYTV